MASWSHGHAEPRAVTILALARSPTCDGVRLEPNFARIVKQGIMVSLASLPIAAQPPPNASQLLRGPRRSSDVLRSEFEHALAADVTQARLLRSGTHDRRVATTDHAPGEDLGTGLPQRPDRIALMYDQRGPDVGRAALMKRERT